MRQVSGLALLTVLFLVTSGSACSSRPDEQMKLAEKAMEQAKEQRAEEFASREHELTGREELAADSDRSLSEREDLVSNRDAELTRRLDELATREKRVRRDEERQQTATERLERHSADLAEREQALARLGQSLLSRRDGEQAPLQQEAARDAPFVEGFDALNAAARSERSTAETQS